MEDKMMIPYIVYEGEQARHERTVKRLLAIIVLTIVMLFVSNLLWLRAWMSYDYVEEGNSDLVLVDGGDRGMANYVGEDGNIVNCENNSQENIMACESDSEDICE